MDALRLCWWFLEYSEIGTLADPWLDYIYDCLAGSSVITHHGASF